MELEFDTLGKRIFGKSFSSAPTRTAVIREKREKEIQQRLFDEPVEEKTLADVPHEYHTIKTDGMKDRSRLIEQVATTATYLF